MPAGWNIKASKGEHGGHSSGERVGTTEGREKKRIWGRRSALRRSRTRSRRQQEFRNAGVQKSRSQEFKRPRNGSQESRSEGGRS